MGNLHTWRQEKLAALMVALNAFEPDPPYLSVEVREDQDRQRFVVIHPLRQEHLLTEALSEVVGEMRHEIISRVARKLENDLEEAKKEAHLEAQSNLRRIWGVEVEGEGE